MALFVEIIKASLSLEESALSYYEEALKYASERRSKDFFKRLCDEKREDIDYWKSASLYAEEDSLPSIFGKPEIALREIKSALSKIEESVHSFNSVEDILFTAMHYEFYPLRSDIGVLYEYLYNAYRDLDEGRDIFSRLMRFMLFYTDHVKSAHLVYLGEISERLIEKHIQNIESQETDALTGLYTKAAFFQHLLSHVYFAQRHNYTVAIIIIGIGNLKVLNKREGHLTGNRLMKHLASEVAIHTRRSDISARYDYSSIVVYLSQTAKNAVESVGSRLIKSFEKKSKEICEEGVRLSIGGGVSVFSVNAFEEVKSLVELSYKRFHKSIEEGVLVSS